MQSILATVTFLLSCIEMTESNKKIDIFFVSYSNPGHMTADGKCCAMETSSCRYKCDNQFNICITDPSLAEQCNYANVETDSLLFDVFSFHYGLQSKLQNPVEKSFTKWPEKLTVTVRVINIRKGRNDLVANFQSELNVVRNIKDGIFKQDLNSSYGNSDNVKALDLQIIKSCASNYVLPDCEKLYCVPQNNEAGHYTCDAATGEKICLDGWKNVTAACTVAIVTTTTAPPTTAPPTTTPPITTTVTKDKEITASVTKNILVVIPTQEASSEGSSNSAAVTAGIAIGCIFAIIVVVIVIIVIKRHHSKRKYETL